MDILLRLILIAAALSGFFLAFSIYRKKRASEKLVCPLNSNCEVVIHSHYSAFLGIPVEFLGLLYYGLLAICYSAFLIIPDLAIPPVIFSVSAITALALLFSLYLTFVQAFMLKEWCAWCLTSAALCAIIFLTTLLIYDFDLGSLPDNSGIIFSLF